MKVYGVTGLPGSGKSIISRIAKKEGIHTISMGDVIREEAEKNNCTTGAAAINLRKKYGNNVVADRCVKKILNHSKNRNNKKTTVKKIYKTHNNHNKNKPVPTKFRKIEQDIYIIEGIRSSYEVKYFKRYFKNFKIIAIHSNQESRFNRLKRRKRSDDSDDYKTFLERDRRELKFGIGNVISLADYMLINEGPIQIFKNSVRALIINEIKPKNNFRKSNKSKNKSKGKSNRRPKQSKKQYKKYNNRKKSNRSNNNRQNKR
ncbi:AAA family ATPase [Methanosphaera sp. WGK6]|uniref:AAA family ATPase n=1 Tax=Methanosphaera sp. WGK6 TaxID=1561964 RepID=UPI00084BC7AA|nr:AAA family ATPase [Methanosphaera sp. WGK6]